MSQQTTQQPAAEPSTPPTVNIEENKGPGCLIRTIWFLVVGLAVGPAWTIIAWILVVTIIGMPLGLWMLNRLPQIMTLRPQRQSTSVVMENGRPVMRHSDVPQVNFFLRMLYFIVIGIWFSLVWLILAWIFATLTFGLGLPLSFWMFDQVPAITTLRRQ